MIIKTLGTFECTALLGKGGMGEVYKAKDQKLGRDVAIKVLPEEFAKDADRVARFQREAKLLASLNHPNIAAIHGLEESDGTHFLVLELIEGDTLADRLRRGAIPVEESLKLALQIAEALEAAHEKGVIHRDLKPANIKVTPDGKAKVLDFGLAKAFAGDSEDMNLSNSPTLSVAATQQGLILGTAAYMSPEQARGKTADRRADIWAFGVVLYEMLTGQRAFEGEDVSLILAAVMKSEPDWDRLPEGLSPSLRIFLRRCFQKDPKQRLRDMGDVRLAVEGAFEIAEGLQAETTTASRPAGWRRAALAVSAALIMGSAIAGFAVWFWMLPSSPPASRWVVAPSVGESLSSQNGTDLAISPDGKFIVYLADNNDTRQLYLRRIDQLEARAIPGTRDAIAPFFSPDGGWIAFGVYPEGRLKKVSLQGGPAVTICDVPDLRNASWGEDGTIVFASGLANGGLFRVSAAGGKPELLASPNPERGEQWYRWPEILPGGRAVVFSTLAEGSIEQAQVAVLSLATGERKILVPGGSNPRYAHTGHLIYGQIGTLMAVPFDLDSLEVTGDPIPIQENVATKTGGAGNFALSHSGSLIYVPGSVEELEASPVWVDREGRVVASIVDQPIMNARYPRLSPDARRLALTTGPYSAGSLWIYELDGRPPTPLALEAHNQTPVWTPDGSRVIFHSTRSGLNLFWMPADGSTLDPEELLTSPNEKYPAAWSPDGRELIYMEVRPESGGDILTLPLEGEQKPKELVASEYNETLAALSPGGRWLAYVSNVTGGNEIWVRSYPSQGAPVRVSPNGGTEPVWSSNGRELFYLQGNKMMAVPVQTGTEFVFEAPTELFDEPYLHNVRPSYDVAPDGRFILIQETTSGQQQVTAGIIVVLNWFEELKEKVSAP